MFSSTGLDLDEALVESMRRGTAGKALNNDACRLHLPDRASKPFQNLGKPGYVAETRELKCLAAERYG